MRKLIIGVDGSPRGTDAIALGAGLASLMSAEPLLVHAHPYGPQGSLLSSGEYERLMRAVTDRAGERASELLGGHAAPIRLVANRSPAMALHDAAQAQDAAAIVVGSSHRGRVGHVLPGSVGRRLLAGAPCPLAVAPAGVAERGALAIRAVGCGFEGSGEAWRALENATELARAAGGSLRVIAIHERLAFGHHAVPLAQTQASVNRRLRDELASDLEAALERARSALGANAEAQFCEGDPAATLAAESRSLDLLVVGSRRYGPVGLVLLGGVAAQLVDGCASALMVVPRA